MTINEDRINDESFMIRTVKEDGFRQYFEKFDLRTEGWAEWRMKARRRARNRGTMNELLPGKEGGKASTDIVQHLMHRHMKIWVDGQKRQMGILTGGWKEWDARNRLRQDARRKEKGGEDGVERGEDLSLRLKSTKPVEESARREGRREVRQ